MPGVYLKVAPGPTAQTFQRLNFVREKDLLHRQFDIQDFQAFFRDHLVPEFRRVPPQGLPDAPTWSGWTLIPPTPEKMGAPSAR